MTDTVQSTIDLDLQLNHCGFYLRLPESAFWQNRGVTLFGNQRQARFTYHCLMWYFIIFACVHLTMVIWNDLKNPDGITSSSFTGKKFRPCEME